MYRDIAPTAAGTSGSYFFSPPPHVNAARAIGPARRAPGMAAGQPPVATLCYRVGVAGKGQNAVGEGRVFAAEVMTPADLLTGDAPGRQPGTDGIRLAFAVDAQHRHLAHLEQL